MRGFQVITLFIIVLSVAQVLQAQSPYTLPELSYGYDALEPAIDARTMEIHHTKHHQGYVNNLNKAVEGTDAAAQTLEVLLGNISNYSVAVRNNGGGHYNHTLFWSVLTPEEETQPTDRLRKAVRAEFGSMESMIDQMNQAAATRFGSGWAWLSVDAGNRLFISSTPNQDNPLMDVVEERGTPILGIDVWEHAYYLQYQNKRGDYLKGIWDVINWDEVSKRYEASVPENIFEMWPELDQFHTVMSQTFHPSEEGDLDPIKNRSEEMKNAAKKLSDAGIPSELDAEEVRNAVADLVADSDKLHKMVQSEATDEELTKALSGLHDTFHLIVKTCHD
ncbi:MAG: superoxide dismutase [Bacteroidales bacterium]|nr:superoxide dismutase [Bacteroidales bacterium]